ncbi:MAG: FkbM family methyltransferase [Pirellulales bacterium]
MSTATPAAAPGVWRGFRRYFRRSLALLLRSDNAKLLAERRKLALQLLRGDAEQLTFRRDGLLWTVFVWDTGVAKYLYSEGSYHGDEIKSLLAWLTAHGRTIGPDNWVLDVGANIGTTSVPLACDTAARVLAVEPIDDNARLLRQNAAQNGFGERITCIEAAVAGEPGEVEMVLSLTNSGGAEIRSSTSRQGFGSVTSSHRTVRVPVKTLNQLIAENGVAPQNVAVVWSDTQGAEAGVMAGGADIWRTGACLFAELWPQGLRAQGGVHRFLAEAGRHFDRFVPCENLQPTDEARPIGQLASFVAAMDDEEFTNALFLPPGFAA